MSTIITDYFDKSTWALFNKCPSIIGTCKIQRANNDFDVDFL